MITSQQRPDYTTNRRYPVGIFVYGEKVKHINVVRSFDSPEKNAQCLRLELVSVECDTAERHWQLPAGPACC